ncbi:Hsp20/alpha crystallin family protein [Clostridium sporogenes]|uniref:Hsp20/alpha crystallin family protein n=1 Tax=Clostridium botulinum TaxID=1491 RepID=A0A6M0T2J8_CLOBO|nr:heat shock protein Hsp18 [Clostridium sporogenes]NFA62017.1 Hsp20/alpha crystallin family protein [Clostridium botulinum]NFI72689.1 Hsp20/alpha crystallin family protein [Clostridium sporogenes]NFL73956.1 Hsp20/alpha crystallin family protein [Clostridium sporogenes]NFM26014.1 Hsp20/alpha crystallin family protein [Clostridium sporogenes]NFP62787.1 Hsp20/alpha crystallin family protein [Clostridium sporogenes]
MFDMIPFRRNNLNKKDEFFSPFFNTFFNDEFFSLMNNLQDNFKVDLKETAEDYLVEADLPGVKKEDITVELANNYLTISAKRDSSIENKKENFVRQEKHYGEFNRSFYINNVDENSIDASFKDDVLKINLPKLDKENFNGKRIDIH